MHFQDKGHINMHKSLAHYVIDMMHPNYRLYALANPKGEEFEEPDLEIDIIHPFKLV